MQVNAERIRAMNLRVSRSGTLVIVSALIVVLCPSAPAQPESSEPIRRVIEFGGVEREYYVRLPANFVEGKTYWPLVVVHGGGGNGRSYFLASGIRSVADEIGLEAIVISPSFSNTDFPASRFPVLGEGAFLKSVLEDLRGQYALQPKILLTGYSRGGQFTHRFAFANPALVKAVAPFSAGTWTTPAGRLLVDSFGEVKDPKSFLSSPEKAELVPERLRDLFAPRVAEIAGMKPNPGAKSIPFLVMCGSLDTRFEIAQEFARSAAGTGFNIETEWPRTPHGSRTKEEFMAEFEKYSDRAAAFFLEVTDGAKSHSQKNPPYPISEYITDMHFDWSSHKRGAIGSDNFQLTWADDDHQYGAWGDGGGFSGERVAIGVARISGRANAWRGSDVWYGDKDNALGVDFSGKSWGIISSMRTLYMWLVPDIPLGQSKRDHYAYVELARSTDHGEIWEKADWRFLREDGLSIPTFLNFGRDNANARDRYIYSYFIDPLDHRQPEDSLVVHKPGKIYLARVRKAEIWKGPEAYEWYAGLAGKGKRAKWASLSEKQPVFEDPNGVGWCMSTTYIRGLDRYMLCTEHDKSSGGLMGIFEATTPWGPWRTVKYWMENDYFGKERPGDNLPWKRNVFYIAFSPKWQSSDGKDFTLTFTGSGRGANNDSFNTLNGSFEIAETTSKKKR